MTSNPPRSDRPAPDAGAAAPDPAVDPVSGLSTEERVARLAQIALHAWNLASRSARAADGGGPGAADSQERLDRLLTTVGRAQQVLRDVADGDGEATGA
jgi:hypothetical protein